MSTTTTLLTFAEFEQLPDAPGKQELIDGEVIEMPPPLKSHLMTAEAIFRLLDHALGEGRVHMKWGYLLGGQHWLQPDISVAWPQQGETRGYPSGAPMIAIEILSARKSVQHIEDKLNLYFAEGAQEVWTVSRKNLSITVHRQAPSGERTSLRITDSYQPDWLSVPVRP